MMSIPSRLFTIAVGAWLVTSAFIWPHGGAQFVNAWSMGLLLMAFGALSIRVESARYACAAVAIWVLFSNWVLPTELEATAWNNILVALSVFMASLRNAQPARQIAAAGPA